MGKPIGYDLMNGLVTLPAIYYAEANPKDEDIKSLSNGGWGNQDRMSRLVESIRKTDAIKKAIHEATQHVDRTIQHIRDSGCKPGLVFNPATSLNWLDYVIAEIDIILVMSVNPGFGGQSFIPQALTKLSEARARIQASGRNIRLEIDGGVKVDNAAAIARAGADTFVAGSAIFGSTDYAGTIKAMRAQIETGRKPV